MTSRRVALFVGGCFWHGCPHHSSRPKTNVEFWLAKLRANVDRDAKIDRRLEQTGWRAIHILEHNCASQYHID